MTHKRIIGFLTAGLLIASAAIAAITVHSGPTSLVPSPLFVKAQSGAVGLFKFNLTQDAGETLSSVTVQVNAVASSTVAAEDIDSLSVYKDNGDGIFDPSTDLLAGTEASVNLNSTTTVATAVHNGIATSTAQGSFFVSLRTAASWSSTSTPPDTIQVVFPTDGIATSANSPAVSSVTTANIIADTAGPTLVSAIAFDTGLTADKTSGDSIVFTFSEATTKPAITSANATSTFMVNNGHSLLDGNGDLGSATWNVGGTVLTLVLTGTSTPPTVELTDTVTIGGTLIMDRAGNSATGSSAVTGTFGSVRTPVITTHIRNSSEVDITGTTVAVGTVIHDHAVVSGSGVTPTGTVDFMRFANGTCTGDPISTESNVALTAGATSSAALATVAGSLSYRVHYDGDVNYSAGDGVCETLTVGKFDSTVTTQVQNASNVDITNTSVLFGTAVHDYATVSGSTTTPTGTVTFTLHGNNTCTNSVLSTQDVALVNGSAPSSATTTLAVGNYGYKVSYSGTDLYSGSTGVCEPFNIVASLKATPAVTTHIQNASNVDITGTTVDIGTVIHDHVIVSGSAGTPTSTVDFMRFANGTCSGDPVATESNVALSGGMASSASYTTTAAGAISYLVHYDGTDVYDAGTAACETLTVQQLIPTPVTTCSNGLINGRLYRVEGNAQVYLAAACRLKPFKGNAVNHANGLKFKNIIVLPSLP